MPSAVIGLDAGTTSIKGLLVASDGRILKQAGSPLALATPQPGWAEQEPRDWWSGLLQVLSELSTSPEPRIEAISISGQMHSLVVLDSQGRSIGPSILWCDQRTGLECIDLTRDYGGEDAVLAGFGNPILTGFTAPKLLWLKRNEPERFDRMTRLALPKDFLALRLTGRLAIEPSDASGTILYRVRNGVWDHRILDQLGLVESALPELIPSGSIIGPLVCDEIPSLHGIPVVAGGADNAAAAYGCGVEKPGDAMVSLGTSGTIVAITADPTVDLTGAVHLFRHVMADSFYHMAVILSATNSLDWFRRHCAAGLSLSQIETLAESSPAGSNGLLFLPYLNGERTPHRDPDARGVLFGLSSFHSQADMMRSIHEGVVFALREGAERITSLGTPLDRLRVVGGGSRSRLWRQMLSDNLGREVWTPRVDEGAAYGSARLAAEAVGWNTAGWVQLVNRTEPDRGIANLYRDWYRLYQDLYRSLRDRFKDLSQALERKG
jgi:xylulokinase